MRTDSPYSGVIVLLYLVMVTGFGLLVAQRSKDRKLEDYFLAGRGVRWVSLGASLFVTTVAGTMIAAVSNPGLRRIDLLVGWGILSAVFALVLGLLFAPRYLRANVYTVPEYLSARFDQSTGRLVSGASILFSLLVRIPLAIVAGSWFLHEAMGWDMIVSATLVVVISGLYTIVGGFPAVVYTQVFQALVVLLGSATVAFVGVHGSLAGPEQLSLSGLWGQATGSGGAWSAALMGAPVFGAWYWFADQFVVHRIMSAQDVRHSRRGTLLTAVLIIVELFLLIAVASEIGLSSPASLMRTAAGELVKGLAAASLLALLMSVLAGYFHSTAALVTLDFIRPLRPETTEESMVLFGRLATTAIVIVSILTVSAASLINPSMLHWMQGLYMYVAPPIAAVLISGMLWERMTARGAQWALAVGAVLGAVHVGWRLAAGSDLFLTDPNTQVFSFAALSFVLCLLVLVGASIMGEKRVAVSERGAHAGLKGSAAGLKRELEVRNP